MESNNGDGFDPRAQLVSMELLTSIYEDAVRDDSAERIQLEADSADGPDALAITGSFLESMNAIASKDDENAIRDELLARYGSRRHEMPAAAGMCREYVSPYKDGYCEALVALATETDSMYNASIEAVYLEYEGVVGMLSCNISRLEECDDNEAKSKAESVVDDMMRMEFGDDAIPHACQVDPMFRDDWLDMAYGICEMLTVYDDAHYIAAKTRLCKDYARKGERT